MTLDAAEFIRRFLLHVLPSGFHRIRHYGLLPERFEPATSSASRTMARRALRASPAETGCDFEVPLLTPKEMTAWAPLPLLWRSDDHRRNLRRRAPRALAIADPDQDRHLMIIVTLPASLCLSPSPPLARQSRNAMSSRPPQTLRPHPPLPSSPPKKRVVFAPDDNTGCPPPPPPHRRSVRDSPKSP